MPGRVKATVNRSDPSSYAHEVQIRGHRLVVDEPREQGGDDRGPTPQELLAASVASCVAMTIEMYAQRKGWELGTIAVSAEFSTTEPDQATRIALELQLPAGCSEDQRRRIEVIATHCPVHRLLEGEVIFEQRVTLATQPGA